MSASTEASPPFSGHTAWVRNLETPLRRFLRTETGSAAVLLAATIAALVWANVDLASYDLVAVLTAHREFDPARLCREARLQGAVVADRLGDELLEAGADGVPLAGRPILESISGLMGYVAFFENFIQIACMFLASVSAILATFCGG